MARIPYAEDSQEPDYLALAERIKAERGGRLLNLYRMLLNSPPVASGWLSLLTAIRQQAALPGAVRELVILRIAVVNKAPYEYASHVPFALREGIPQAKIDALADWRNASNFDDRERAALAYADTMTTDIEVPDAVFDAAAAFFDNREMTELTATIAAYNLVSRFLVALKIDHEPAKEPEREPAVHAR